MADTKPPKFREQDHSGLEVANDRERYAPEVDLRHQSDKEAVFVNDGYVENKPITSSYSSSSSSSRKRRICGMRRPVAFTVFAVAGLLAVGAIVGGAVGGTMAASSSSDSSTATPVAPNPTVPDPQNTISPTSSETSTSSSSTTSETSTASASATPIGDGLGTYTCPESDNVGYTTSSGTGSQMFIQLCDVDWPVGVDAPPNSALSTVEDLSVVLAYSLQQCIDQCAVHSINNSPPCMAVTYGANVTAAQDRGMGGNCWLKSSRGAVDSSDTSGQAQAAYAD